MSDETRPAGWTRETARCASCQKPHPEAQLAPCAICKRPVCAACLGAYGHHMLACEDCRLAPW
jgi:hypothetical protein